MAESDLPAILLVDDSADKLVAIQAILADLPAKVVTAQSGREALRYLLRHDFAVILLDVRMPGMDGFETATLIRGRPRSEHTPIIFITALGDDTHVARGYSLKAVDYLLTPVVPDVLRTKVGVLVELYAMHARVRRQAESLRHLASQLNRLAAASLAINAAPSLDRIAHLVAERARDIVGARRAVVLAQLDERRRQRAVALLPDSHVDDTGEEAVTSVVMRTNKPYRASNGAVLGVPLVGCDGRNMGVLQVAGPVAGSIEPEDEDLLVQLSQMAAVALENTLYAEAREANRLKDEFLATVSHELRTPLSAILSWTAILRRQGTDEGIAERAVDAIERNARAQARLVDDLLDVSRIDSGKLQIDAQPVDVVAVARAAADSHLATADAKGLHLEIVLPDAQVLVRGDPDRLQQVASNLLANAVKFTPAGGRVVVSLGIDGGEAVLCIQDTGVGIPPRFLPHVFERFRQVDGTARRAAGGLGLGLAIVRHLVELHDGSVEAHSAGEGQGATFVIRLPITRTVAAAASGDAPVADVEHHLRGLHVLVVEDEPDIREALMLTVGRAGGVTRGVATVRDALDTLAEWEAHVLVCDIGLPGEDGYALVRQVRSLPRERGGGVPAIALTAYARARDRGAALAAGFAAHLAKPVDAPVLLDTLREHDPRPPSARDRDGALPLQLDGAAPAAGTASTRPPA